MTDPTALPGPNTIVTAVYAKSPIASPTSPTSSGTLSPRSAASRLASRLTTLPKRMLGNKPTQSQAYTFPLPPTTAQPRSGSQPSVKRLGKGHTHTNSDFKYSADTSSTGPHPGQPYDPFATQPAFPQPKTATDCWDDDPPHVRRRLQTRPWEGLFGDFNWSRSVQSPKRGYGRRRHDWGDVSPRSCSPHTSPTRGDRDGFWIRDAEHRGRTRERERDWDVGPGYGQKTSNGSGDSFWNQPGASP